MVPSPRTDLEAEETGSSENNLLEVICINLDFVMIKPCSALVKGDSRAFTKFKESPELSPEFVKVCRSFNGVQPRRAELHHAHSRLKLKFAILTLLGEVI
ncbi:unnamed protein product [Cuscuta epithymum]|uniref:Uncharacterized protein n=1 Tax=Cuscuta epithymum TaxID=186058 RepID=A0AAV0G2F1_9ASTE|nr:unnamed protein product [Cuscuta epithymum]